MRVLHLLDAAVPRRNDYTRRTLALLGQLRAQGVQTVHLTAPPLPPSQPPAGSCVHVPTPGAGDDDAHAARGWHFYRTAAPWPASRHARGLAPWLAVGALARRLRQVTRLTRPDLIHVHAPGNLALSALPVARLARLPLVVEAERRGPHAGALATLEDWARRRADALAAGSIDVRALLRRDGVPGRRIAVIPPAPDMDAAPVPAHARGPVGLEGAPLIVYAGRLRRQDGLDLLLAVLPALRRRYPALRLLVAGGGSREDELADRLRAPGLRGHVAVTGKLGGRRAADLLPRADIAVFPALDGEAALLPSRHLLNAMSQGCAIVASDIACHRDLLVHGHSGVLFGAGSGVALLDALQRLLAEPARLGALGRAASACVAAQHSWASTAARYRCLYEAVLAQHGRRR